MKVLIVDSGGADFAGVARALAGAGFHVVGIVHGTSDLYRHVRQLAPDAIVVAADAPQRDCLEDIAISARHAPKPVIMLAASASDEVIRRACDVGLSFYVAPEMPPALIRSLIVTAASHHQRARILAQDLDTARARLEEQRVITEAKCQLMERDKLSESDAYHRMRKLAMRQGRRVAEVARALLEDPTMA
jgi:response regulator NasT